MSTDEQVERGHSLDDQLARGRAWVAAQDSPSRPTVLVGDYADEGYSGTMRFRPGLQAALAAAVAGDIDTILITKLDRLARRLKLLLEIWDEVEAAGCTIVVIDESIDTSTAVGRLIRNVLGSIAEFERELIVSRTRAGRLARARKGHVWKAQTPYGYRYLPAAPGVRARGELVIDPAEASVVADIFGMAMGGMSQHAIGAALDARGIRPRRGAATWRQNSISDLLRNRTYMGDAIYNMRETTLPRTPRTPVERRKREKSAVVYRDEAEWVHMPAPAIVTPEVWQAVAALRERNRATAARNTKNEYMLGRGLLLCGACAAAGRGRVTMVGHRRRATWFKYECSSGWRGGRLARDEVCTARVDGPLIEARVWDALLARLGDEALLDTYAAADGAFPLAASPIGRGAGGVADVVSLLSQVPSAESGRTARLDSLRARHGLLSGSLGLADTPAKVAALLGQIDDLHRQIVAAERDAANVAAGQARAVHDRAVLIAARDAARLIANAGGVARPDARGALVRDLVDAITVYAAGSADGTPAGYADVAGADPALCFRVQL